MNNRTNTAMAATESAKDQGRKSGRAAFTEDGRSTWEWQTATGVFTRTITAEQLASFEATDLELMEVSPASGQQSGSGVSESLARMSSRSADSAVARQPKSHSPGVLQVLLRRLLGSH